MKKVSILKSIIFSVALMFVAVSAEAEMEFNTNNNYCHFILGIDDNGNSVKDGATVDGDNEVFLGNCINSITTVANVADGATKVTVKYPSGEAMPILKSISLTGTETGTDCNMTDSNNVAYTTNDWSSYYKVRGAIINGNGKIVAEGNNAQIIYRLTCRNAPEN